MNQKRCFIDKFLKPNSVTLFLLYFYCIYIVFFVERPIFLEMCNKVSSFK